MNIENIESENKIVHNVTNQENTNKSVRRNSVSKSSADNSASTENNSTSLRVGPGRPRILLTKILDISTKQFYVLGTAVEINDVVIPKNYLNIKGNKYENNWYDAAQSEYDSLLKNN